MAQGSYTTIEAAGHELRFSNPDRVFFPQAGHTKLDVARYYLEVAEAALIHLRERPTTLKRFASAYSVRPVPDARVSCPLEWEEVADVDPAELRLDTVPARLRERADPSAAIDGTPGSLAGLLELAARDGAEGLGDAPWPPHFPKQKGEPRRVQPSRARRR